MYFSGIFDCYFAPMGLFNIAPCWVLLIWRPAGAKHKQDGIGKSNYQNRKNASTPMGIKQTRWKIIKRWKWTIKLPKPQKCIHTDGDKTNKMENYKKMEVENQTTKITSTPMGLKQTRWKIIKRWKWKIKLPKPQKCIHTDGAKTNRMEHYKNTELTNQTTKTTNTHPHRWG